MGVVHPGPRNPNWKGGRSIASNGYVLQRVGTGHHLADVRGYAYEHRVVAEQKLGRCLRDDEEVHHIDEDKQNNDPSNLEVVTSAEHGMKHRTSTSRLRYVDEPNPTIHCQCGCGKRFPRFDTSGRPREYVSGHNPQIAEVRSRVIAALQRGAASRAEIARRAGLEVNALASHLTILKRSGIATNLGGGMWSAGSTEPTRLPGSESSQDATVSMLSAAIADALRASGIRAKPSREIALAIRIVAELYDDWGSP